MNKPVIFTLLFYAIVSSGLAFILHDLYDLLYLAIPPFIMSILILRGKLKWIMLAYALGLTGVFVNAVIFANTGEAVLSIGSLIIRENAVNAFIAVSMKLLAIATSGALFALLYSPVEIYRGLAHEVGIPTSITLPLAYSLRLLPVIKRDLSEVVFQRKQRGYRTVFLNPLHLSGVLTTLMAINFERAKWSGVNAEIRGLRRIKPRWHYRLGYTDILIYVVLSFQISMIVLF